MSEEAKERCGKRQRQTDKIRRLEKLEPTVMEEQVKNRQKRHVWIGKNERVRQSLEFRSERESNTHVQPDNDPG